MWFSYHVLTKTCDSCPNIQFDSDNDTTHILVDRSNFEADLWKAFRNDDRGVSRQVALDAPRCNMFVDGIRQQSLPVVERAWLPYLTQAVVAFSAILLFQSGIQVLDSTGQPLSMQLMTNDGEFLAHKVMRRWENDRYGDSILLTVHAERESTSVVLSFTTLANRSNA